MGFAEDEKRRVDIDQGNLVSLESLLKKWEK